MRFPRLGDEQIAGLHAQFLAVHPKHTFACIRDADFEERMRMQVISPPLWLEESPVQHLGAKSAKRNCDRQLRKLHEPLAPR